MAAHRAFGQSLPEDISRRLAQAQQDGKVSGLHALLVSQGGELLFEYYGRGDDEAWGRPLGTVVFAPMCCMTCARCPRAWSVWSMASRSQPAKCRHRKRRLYDQFPEYPDLAAQPDRDRLTMHHVLSMTLGLEWDELTIPYGDPRNSENAMEASPDRFRFILERSIVGEPGAKWTYCGGATALLGRLIAKGTGEALLAYCRRVLFDPLDFGPAEWTTAETASPTPPRACACCRATS